jgi:hypothetical protein
MMLANAFAFSGHDRSFALENEFGFASGRRRGDDVRFEARTEIPKHAVTASLS